MVALQVEAEDAGRVELLWMDVNVNLIETAAATLAARC